MVDTFEAQNGRIVMRDSDGTVVFDTDERLFTVTNQLSGSVGLPSRVSQNRNQVDIAFANVDTLHHLGACNADADTVRGAFLVQTSGGSQGALTNIGYFNASGTYVHYFGAINGALGGSGNQLIASIALYTFRVISGNVYVHEKVRLKADWSLSSGVTNTITLLAPTFTYNLLVGAWV